MSERYVNFLMENIFMFDNIFFVFHEFIHNRAFMAVHTISSGSHNSFHVVCRNWRSSTWDTKF